MKKIIFTLWAMAVILPAFAEAPSAPLVATLRLPSDGQFEKDQLSPKNKKALEDAVKKDWEDFGDPMSHELYRVDLDGDGTWEYVILQDFQNNDARVTVLEGEDGRILCQDTYPKGEDCSLGFASLIDPKQKEILVVYQGGYGTAHFGFVVDVLKKKGNEVKKIFENYFYYFDWNDENKEYEEINYIALAGAQPPYQLQVFDGKMKSEWRSKKKNKSGSDWGNEYDKLMTIPIVRKSRKGKPKEVDVWDEKKFKYLKQGSSQ